MTSSAPATTDGSSSLLDRHYHLIRRLHSLTGVVPIGVFLFPHLTTNSSIVWGHLNQARFGNAGVETFQHEVNFIHSLPALVMIELFVLWIPIAFHAGAGIWFARTGRGNYRSYTFGDNLRYSLQRLSGYIGVIFIFMHVSSLRWGWTWWGLLPGFDPHHAASSTAAHLQEGALGLGLAFLYLICVLALVYHFANGLWTAAITWGLTISSTAQRRWGGVCAAIGLALAAAGTAAVIGFARVDVEEARAVERAMLGDHEADEAPMASPSRESRAREGTPTP